MAYYAFQKTCKKEVFPFNAQEGIQVSGEEGDEKGSACKESGCEKSRETGGEEGTSRQSPGVCEVASSVGGNA